MPRTSLANVTPHVVGTISRLVVVGLLLSACAGCTLYKIVPAADLEADRQHRQALQAKRQHLLEELRKQLALQGELEKQLAAQGVKHQALQQRQAQFERDLKQRSAASEALNDEVAELEKLLAEAGLKRQEWAQWQEQLERDLKQQCAANEELGDDVAELVEQQIAVNDLKHREWALWVEECDLKQQSAASEALDYDDANLYLLLLEKKAHVARLSEQIEKVILEVVRAKAKLHSLKSKAEAASNLAEAEIAVESLKAGAEASKVDPSAVKAEQLTRLSAREFEEGNYGGALYLTSEAKRLIESARAQSVYQEKSAMVKGEVPFLPPLALRLLVESNIRDGPGSHFDIMYSLENGTALMGYAFKGQWVRVAIEEGLGGWVFYKSVGSN